MAVNFFFFLVSTFKVYFKLINHGFWPHLFCSLGANVKFKLHTWILVSILDFLRISIACKWKFSAIYKQYKNDKIVTNISTNDCHECLFYDALDNCGIKMQTCECKTTQKNLNVNFENKSEE